MSQTKIRRKRIGSDATAATNASRYGSEFPLPDTHSEDIVQAVTPAAGNSTGCDKIGIAAPVTEEPTRALPPTVAAAAAGRAAPATEDPMKALTLAGEPIASAAAGPTRATLTPGNESAARAALAVV